MSKKTHKQIKIKLKHLFLKRKESNEKWKTDIAAWANSYNTRDIASSLLELYSSRSKDTVDFLTHMQPFKHEHPFLSEEVILKSIDADERKWTIDLKVVDCTPRLMDSELVVQPMATDEQLANLRKPIFLRDLLPEGGFRRGEISLMSGLANRGSMGKSLFFTDTAIKIALENISVRTKNNE